MYFLEKNIKIGRWVLPLPAILWFSLAALAAILELSRGLGDINNYLIYEGVFRHLHDQQKLYLEYPKEYFDANHYGPVFSLIIAPFTFLPVQLGCFLWCLTNAFVLFYAIRQLPLSNSQRNIILLIGMIEMMTSIHSVQFNPMLTGWVVLSFISVEKRQPILATLYIALGMYIKLYGIIGLAFFFFSKDQLRFVLSFAFWVLCLFFLPMLISSPGFVLQSYLDWYHSLVDKNISNVTALAMGGGMQDISLMGMARRISNNSQLSNFWAIIPAGILYIIPFFRKSQFSSLAFRLYYLALALIGVVIFSSSAESPTYVIAVTGVAIWFIIERQINPQLAKYLLILTFLLTILSPTDLVPRYIKQEWIIRYSLKALPCSIIWVLLIFRLLFTRFDSIKLLNNE